MEGLEIWDARNWENLTVWGVLMAGQWGLAWSRGPGTLKLELYKARLISNLTP